MPQNSKSNPLEALELPTAGHLARWGGLSGSALWLAVAEAARRHRGVSLLITPDTQTAERLEQEMNFFLAGEDLPTLSLPDWETLPYDVFSPHEDIVSRRLETLYHLPALRRGALIIPVTTLMQRLPPRAWLQSECLMLQQGERIDRDKLREGFEQAGYQHVSQVMEHGEYAVRGALMDVYPMGSDAPYRIDLLDDEIETIRTFDPETQRSRETIQEVRLLPAHEFPLNEAGIKAFRQHYRTVIEGDPQASHIYREVSQGSAPAGIEYYLPLFFKQMETLFDYLPDNTLAVHVGDTLAAAQAFADQVAHRYEQRRHDRERPLLPPDSLFLGVEDVANGTRDWPTLELTSEPLEDNGPASTHNANAHAHGDLRLQTRQAEPARALNDFFKDFPGRVLLMAESPGRREVLLDTLRPFGIIPHHVESWAEFLASDASPAITIGPLQSGLCLPGEGIAVLTESELFGEKARQERRRRKPTRDADAVVRNLTDLHAGAPVVHEDHGVGRYLGLQKITAGGQETEFLTLEYAGGDKLYVPVASLHLVSRYTGADPEHAPLHKLGTETWSKARRKAAEKARDVAAELLDIYARRAARQGHAYQARGAEYTAFAAAFPFEETPDQLSAIDAVLDDMASERPMDRVVCGDVGFGKTEVAMRAAFVAIQGGKQVAVLVPTTLLAQQHDQNFRDRFADWPVRIESLSRFGSQKQHQEVMKGLEDGRVDIVIGTHKLIQGNLRFKNLGLVIIDEEQRFGVRHKERLKSLRAEVDMLTLTATPIPRTLNMALSGLRDLSIIATPPEERLTIKTFVSQWNSALIQEACLREIRRGGQVYYLHNEVQTIEKAARELQEQVPSATIGIAHGQMRERELEQVMLDFYHRRYNVLVCTTIIETGIDVPTANTIIINRADKMGLSQLHQLRGRVGRSHHRAYAYLITPHPSGMTKDAVKRLEAIESLEDLGVGFTLASHDLEIRGAGELLGDEQSGQIQEIGFTLYNELLDRAVKALKEGKVPDLDHTTSDTTEVDLGLPALLPDDYVPDIHTRLILYKRLSACQDTDQLREMEVEMVDRFGLLPAQAKNLVEATRLKLRLQPLGARKLEVGPKGGRLIFHTNPSVDPMSVIQLVQSQPESFRLDGQDTLRFTAEMESLDQRVESVNQLLGRLQIKQDAAA
ncbi:transcription-repair coupling factor [Ectothiorhodospira haloalkaliphila]|uniref:Transcription-repair-coupling factor n=1 Tax=Ectothiorhodospira haloalkaliphila TaxID=421628 RepID=W8KJY6_9GAMM|nr:MULTISPECIES: transcription-repair coupling factor [Ectothiorhodospira]AHK79473.1 transcription-repair coupling factor [Ectothiorhodospira haloalkaliphila]MCG5495114.1 transcription-repair coupling factor [Ectothiorhodospira variabilis]MCG5503808.1 transcription-repair coupling factor [Ectothiorhodospira variabilis]MCG5507061.1 transcription-repair coupling factor [Ectothiorhodospira variabilis]